jgi:hypothetical protein
MDAAADAAAAAAANDSQAPTLPKEGQQGSSDAPEPGGATAVEIPAEEAPRGLPADVPRGTGR